MARFRRKRRRKQSAKIRGDSPNASLAAMAPIIECKGIFSEIHQGVTIPQKTVTYRPTDKRGAALLRQGDRPLLVLITLSLLAGNETISEVNWKLRVDKPLLMAFGYSQCPDQSTLQDTLDAATDESVKQLKAVATSLFAAHNLLQRQFQHGLEPEQITIDFDLSAQPSSKKADKATKGYFAKRKNSYGRQLARISVADTAEIVADRLYSGNTLSSVVFKEMVLEMEQLLALGEKSTRSKIRLRLDGGFGTDENINFALSRGYQLLVKMYSGNRARKLAMSVDSWEDAPTKGQPKNGESATRQAAWLKTPHRYCRRGEPPSPTRAIVRKTRQIAIRTPNPKNKVGYSYRVIVTTDLNRSLGDILNDYDRRSGIAESVFCQDNQGLGARKRRKQSFSAQQVLVHLTTIAHNLCLWLKQWTIDAIEFHRRCEQWVEQVQRKLRIEIEETENLFANSIALLKQRGIKRLTHQLFCLSGDLLIKRGRLRRIVFKDGYPLMNRIFIAFSALLTENCVQLSIAET
jgi:hypothetical protein